MTHRHPRLSRTSFRPPSTAARTGEDILFSTQPIDAVPSDGGAYDTTDDGTVRVFDPASRSIRPLAHQPNLRRARLGGAPTQAGIWVDGLDAVTHRPATAVSRDGGRTWITHTFAGLPAVPPSLPEDVQKRGGKYVQGAKWYLPRIASYDGRTAYAMVLAYSADAPADRIAVFRTTDAGTTWTLTSNLSQRETVAYRGYATPDNAHVIQTLAPPPQLHLLVSTDGRSYAPRNVDGFAEEGSAWLSIGPGTPFLALSGGGFQASMSEDGLAWRTIWKISCIRDVPCASPSASPN